LLLVVSTLSALAFTARLSWQVYGPGGWRDEVYGQVGMNATKRAMEDFRRGHLRLYALGGESEKPHFMGKMDGQFEVWTPQFYPSLGRAHRYATEQFVEFYNRKMRYMHSHPEKFPRSEEKVQPDGAANGSQPIRSETNSTSLATGSRR
jgi:hypothetical protein